MARGSRLLRVLLAVLIAFMLLVYLAGAVAAKAVDQRRMAERFAHYSDTSASGVSSALYPDIAAAITGYLSGRLESAQLTLAASDGERQAFSEEELLHLRDIRGLVRLAALLRYAAIALFALSLAAFFVLRRLDPELIRQVRPERSLRWAGLTLFMLLAALILWGLLDFEGLFTAAHRLAFRNDLWLLDPARDLLLQLMPMPFFVSYGWDLLKENAFVLLLLPLAAFGLRQPDRKAHK